VEIYSTLCRQRSSQSKNRGHKSPLLQSMTALLHYNFLFMWGKCLNYIDLRSVLAIDKVTRCTMTWYSYHTATYYKWPNFCFDRNPNMSPVHPQGGRCTNFGQPVPCPTPGRIDRNSTVLMVNMCKSLNMSIQGLRKEVTVLIPSLKSPHASFG